MGRQNTREPKNLVFRVPGIRALRLPIIIPKPTGPLSTLLILIYGFIIVIIIGTILLVLPISSSSGQFTPFTTALFSTTSAACVTGLVVVDTGTYWSTFGQAVLLVLFQTGGLGFIIGATLLLLAIGGRFGLKERLVLSESIGIDRLGGILGVVVKVATFTLVIEGAGAVIFYFRWLAAGGDTSASLWRAVFHAVSAFNNCGMDIFGNFNSLIGFQSDAITLFTTAVLIVFGSIGYLVVADVISNRKFIRLSLDSKIVLIASGSLILIGTIFYLIAEYSSLETLGQFTLPQKIMVAFFQAITPRTAGFNAIDIGSLKQISLFFTMFLMFIGGAAGSTAGGLKVNTFGVLLTTVISIIRGRMNVEAFYKQIPYQAVYRALALLFCYLGVFSLVTIGLTITEIFPIDKILFEAFSALSTVGLSTGITPDLSLGGRLIIIVTMFVGRLGPLALITFIAHRQQPIDTEYPHENIRLG